MPLDLQFRTQLSHQMSWVIEEGSESNELESVSLQESKEKKRELKDSLKGNLTDDHEMERNFEESREFRDQHFQKDEDKTLEYFEHGDVKLNEHEKDTEIINVNLLQNKILTEEQIIEIFQKIKQENDDKVKMMHDDINELK